MVDYNKYQDVTYNQIDMMKHAIGFDDRKVKGTKHRKYEPYRNIIMLEKETNQSLINWLKSVL